MTPVRLHHFQAWHSAWAIYLPPLGRLSQAHYIATLAIGQPPYGYVLLRVHCAPYLVI